MPITVTDLQTLGIQTTDAYLKGVQSISDPVWKRIAQEIKMTTNVMEAPILSMVGPLREWTGPRMVEHVKRDSYTIRSKKYEKTVAIDRESVEDDNVGVYMPAIETLGQQSEAWPDQQVITKLEAGETDLCYDGLPFFSASHQVEHGYAGAGTYSNLTGTGNPAWYVFDASKSLKPLIWALRVAPEFTNRWDPSDPHVFDHDEYISGVRARGVADYGFPQLAHKCKNALDATNWEAISEGMAALENGAGENLGATATLVLIPSSLQNDAKRLWGRSSLATGEDNIHKGGVPWLVCQRLSNT